MFHKAGCGKFIILCIFDENFSNVTYWQLNISLMEGAIGPRGAITRLRGRIIVAILIYTVAALSSQTPAERQPTSSHGSDPLLLIFMV